VNRGLFRGNLRHWRSVYARIATVKSQQQWARVRGKLQPDIRVHQTAASQCAGRHGLTWKRRLYQSCQLRGCEREGFRAATPPLAHHMRLYESARLVAVSAGAIADATLTGPGFCGTRCVSETPSPIDLSRLADRYNVTSSVVEDLYARRRAGARDAELINLLQQTDRGGLDAERAHALVAELPER
jgi:hypothetical protein